MYLAYVLDADGKPLMPTKRPGRVRRLLKSGKAFIKEYEPFTIQLKYGTPGITQDVTLGIDPGRTNVGAAAVTDGGGCLMAAELTTRNREIPELMKKRASRRRARRKHGRREPRQRRAKANGTVKAEAFARRLPQAEEDVELHWIRNKEARYSNRTREPGWLTPTANQLLETHLNLVGRIRRYLPATGIS